MEFFYWFQEVIFILPHPLRFKMLPLWGFDALCRIVVTKVSPRWGFKEFLFLLLPKCRLYEAFK
jgi:hypothetical protein